MATKAQEIELTEQEEAKIQTATELYQQANSLAVRDPESHTEATEVMVRLQTKIREVEDIRDHQLEPIRNAKREIEEARKRTVDFFERILAPLRTVKSIVDRRAVAWRREERRKAELEASRKRAAELKKIEANKQKVEKVAERLEKKGLNEDAAALRDKEAARPAPAPAEVAPRIETAKGSNVKIEMVSEVNEERQANLLKKLIDEYNASHKAEDRLVPGAYWAINRKALDAFGKKTEGQIAIPGVRWVENERTDVRRRK